MESNADDMTYHIYAIRPGNVLERKDVVNIVLVEHNGLLKYYIIRYNYEFPSISRTVRLPQTRRVRMPFLLFVHLFDEFTVKKSLPRTSTHPLLWKTGGSWKQTLLKTGLLCMLFMGWLELLPLSPGIRATSVASHHRDWCDLVKMHMTGESTSRLRHHTTL